VITMMLMYRVGQKMFMCEQVVRIYQIL